MIAAFKGTQDFAIAADKIMEKIAYSAQLPPITPPDPEHNRVLRRRSSTRMSISRRMGPGRASISGNPLSITGPNGGVVMEWEQDLYEPFADFQSDYSVHERRFLIGALDDIFGPELHPPPDTARLLRERSVDVFSAADDAINRCIAFTHGYGCAGLVGALDAFLSEFAERSKADLLARRSAAAGRSADALATSASGELSDLDYEPEDWADIQTLLHLASQKELNSEKSRSWTTLLFNIIFPSSKPAINALLATAYISGPPNFLLVDYYNRGSPEEGSVFRVAAAANGVTYNKDCCGLDQSAAPLVRASYIGLAVAIMVTVLLAW